MHKSLPVQVICKEECFLRTRLGQTWWEKKRERRGDGDNMDVLYMPTLPSFGTQGRRTEGLKSSWAAKQNGCGSLKQEESEFKWKVLFCLPA